MKKPVSIELERKKMRKELILAFSAALIIGLIFLIETAILRSTEDIPFAGHVLLFTLLGIVILLLILIIFFLIRNFFKLIFERRGRVLGSHLKTRLTLGFVALTLVPTVVLFIASAGVLHTSIESWFKSQVEESLQSSLVIAQAFYQNASDKALSTGARVASVIAVDKLLEPINRDTLKRFLDATLMTEGVSSFQVYFRDASAPILIKDPSLKQTSIPPPIASFLKIAFQGEKTSKITALDDGGDLVSAIVPVKDPIQPEVTAALVVDYIIPTSLAARLYSVSKAFGDYQEARRMKEPVKTVNVLLLLMVALLVILIGFWFGMTMAGDITDPILNLTKGAEKIASGDLDIYIEPSGDDELASLVKSFNKMALDLRVNRDELIRVNHDLESRRKYMETVVKNIAAGVLSVDPEGRITTINTSAKKLLGINESNPIGRSLAQILPPASRSAVEDLMEQIDGSGESLQQQMTISFPDKVVSLLCFAGLLKEDESTPLGTALVFEDMTYLIKAQRMAAWREVARRIAHEIKNPLTPIQLNAQRIRRKYLDALGAEGEILDQCTRVIVDQVEQLKIMVNEFSKFARLPAANPTPSDLNAIIKDTVDLYNQSHDSLRIEFKPDPTIPTFDLDKEQIKRVLVNLLDNAVTATSGRGSVWIKTNFDANLAIASVEVLDDGIGIAPRDRDKLFEPYFSRKPGGTGLGLTIVSAIISDHNGFIRIKSGPRGGAGFVIELPVNR